MRSAQEPVKQISFHPLAFIVVLSLLSSTASGCQPKTTPVAEQEHAYVVDEMPSLSPVSLSGGQKLRVVATTSIVADVVRNVGGELIDLTTLIPLGTDPHAFEPTPQDVTVLAKAHVVFISGAGLEVFLDQLLESAGEQVIVVPVSYGIELLEFGREPEHQDEQGNEQEREREDEHQQGVDPHTWFDPNNVIVWTQNIERALSTLDPNNAAKYEANAEAYEAKLEELDAWIREQLDPVPEANRELVTDHTALTYLLQRYGFEQIGAVFPGYSTLAEPSAQDLAKLEDAIREFQVKAIFVGLTVNPDLAERVADDTGTRLVFLYTGSLS